MKNSADYNIEEEITLKTLILKLQEYAIHIIKNWLLIGLITLPFIGYFTYKTLNHVPQYVAEVRFIVEGQGGSSLGALGGLLGSFGINRGNSSKTNPYKIIEVARSKKMIGDVLFTSSTTNSDYLANNIISSYNLADKWSENTPSMKGFKYEKRDIDLFNKDERRAFLSIFNKTIGNEKNRENALLRINLNEESGIFTVKSITEVESLSIDLASSFYENIKNFFEEQVLADHTKSIKVLKSKADSLDNLISSKSRLLAQFDDSSRGLISRESELTRNKLNIENQGNISALIEIKKSIEIADYEIQNQKPLFILIDKPYSPLRATAQSLIISIFLGSIIGIFIGITIVIIRKFYIDTINN